MFYIFVFYILLCLINISFKNVKTNNKDFLSKETTTCINGIFVGIILFSHFNGYVIYTSPLDIIYYKIIRRIGQLMVSTFFMYSGYGILESIKNKKNYIDKFFKNRILKLVIIFSLSMIVWIIFNLVIKSNYSISDYLIAFTGWEGIGNSCWFIFATFCMYFITLFSFKIFKKDNLKAMLMCLLGSFVYIIIMKYLKDDYWYNTILCYNLGMFISYYKDNIINYLKDNTRYVITFVCLIFTLFLCYTTKETIVMYFVYSICFCLCVLLFSFKVKIGNKILNYLGVNTFNIYILQRLSFIIYKRVGLIDYNIYLYFIVSVITTLIIVFIFDKILKLVLKLVYKNSTT